MEGAPTTKKKKLTKAEKKRRRIRLAYEAILPEKTRTIRAKRKQRLQELGITVKTYILWMNHLCKVIFITPAHRLVVWNEDTQEKHTIGGFNNIKVTTNPARNADS